MDRPATQPPGHGEDEAPAPGELELVRSFLSLHDHPPGDDDGSSPSVESLEWWLRERGLLEPAEEPSPRDLRWALGILEAMRTKVLEQTGSPRDPEAIESLNMAARDTGLRLCFGCDDGGRLHTTSTGVRGAMGRLLGLMFLAELDGTWRHFKECSNPTCRSVFYDRSKNHSGRWCSMASCGNRAKVRAFRERERSEQS
jgi:CGNR zinc finger/Putative stress-induced transcription regulator